MRKHPGWKTLGWRLVNRLIYVGQNSLHYRTKADAKGYSGKSERKRMKRRSMLEIKARGGRHVPHRVQQTLAVM